VTSFVGRNVHFCSERYCLHLHDVLRYLSFDNMSCVSRPISDTLSCADVISELAMVRDGVLMFSNSHFSIANAHCCYGV